MQYGFLGSIRIKATMEPKSIGLAWAPPSVTWMETIVKDEFESLAPAKGSGVSVVSTLAAMALPPAQTVRRRSVQLHRAADVGEEVLEAEKSEIRRAVSSVSK